MMFSKKISESATLERLVGGGELETENRGEKPVKSNDRCSREETNYRNMYSLLHRMCNHAPDMIWAKDLECRYLFANQAICDGLLKAKDAYEPIGKTDLFFALRERASRPEDPQWHTFGEICCNSDMVVLESAQPGQFEEFGNVRGKFVCLDVRKAPFFDDEGRLIGTVGCARDITRERETEQALRESEAKFRSYVLHSPYGVFVTDKTGRYLEANPAASRLTGYAEAELLTKSFPDLLLPESLAEGIGHFERLLQNGSSDGELCHKTRSGEIRWWSVAARQISENRFIGFCDDITERKQVEEKVHTSQARYQALVEQSCEALILIDVQTHEVVEVNRQFTELLGYSLPADSPLYMHNIGVESNEDRTKRYAMLQRQTVMSPEKKLLRHKNGSVVTVERVATVISINAREYLLGSIRDLTAELRRQTNMERDIMVAHKIQRELLPEVPESVFVTSRTLYYPSHFVSGDSYLLKWRKNGKLLCGFLVDMSGHGMATALQTASINVLLREVMKDSLPLIAKVQRVNARAAKYLTDGSYAALLGFELDLSRRELRYVAAGITRFYANGKKIETPGMFVGIWDDAEFHTDVVPVAVGDTFYFLTDGFTDLLEQPENAGFWSPDGKDFDADVAALEKLAGSGNLRDDATGICLKIKELL